jgi:hypothetical protein
MPSSGLVIVAAGQLVDKLAAIGKRLGQVGDNVNHHAPNGGQGDFGIPYGHIEEVAASFLPYPETSVLARWDMQIDEWIHHFLSSSCAIAISAHTENPSANDMTLAVINQPIMAVPP